VSATCCVFFTQSIIKSYRQACALAVSKVKELSVSLEGKGDDEKRELLLKCAATSLNSKLVRGGAGSSDVE
jgi:T-complex protein 1 subunit eta